MSNRIRPVFFLSFLAFVVFSANATPARAEAVKRVIKVITRSDLQAMKAEEDATPMALSDDEILSVEATMGKGKPPGRAPASSAEEDAAVPGMDAPSSSIAPGSLKPNKHFVTWSMVESDFAKGATDRRRRFFISAGGALDESLGGLKAGDFSIGLMPEFLMVSLRLRFGSSNFGALRAYPGASEDPTLFPSGSDPDSEYNRVRASSDPWGLMLYDVGFGVQENLLPALLPGCTERVRFMAGLGTLTDTVNDLKFSAWHMTFESGLQWQPSQGSIIGLDIAGWYQFGVGVREDAASRNLGRLPFDWLGMTASVFLWL